MVDKLRKIAAWVWLNKERMVLLIAVGILCYRVYEVIFPPPPEEPKPTNPPKNELPAPGPETEKLLPPSPPPRPPIDAPDDYASLYRRNPFSYSSAGGGGATEVKEDELDIALLNIQPGNDGARAQLRAGAAKKWYKEGEPFQGYVLEDIDVDAKTVTIYSEQLEKRQTLEMEQPAS
ncbi:MAG: hypothetical protein HYV26_07165 [Candidatus Hydrogenedentes bacterium]|nr:hypothetical protein [Candidatus Hydrogenedentota bacterium]